MKLWPLVALATMSSALVWACEGGEPAPDDGGGAGGSGTGGSATGGGGTGGGSTGGQSPSGGAATTGGEGGGGGQGGFGGAALTCDSSGDAESWGGAGGAGAEEIFGDWTDQYGSTYSIDEDIIDAGYGDYHTVGISGGGQYIIAQNDEANGYYPCLFSRFDWYVDDDGTYLCQRAYGEDSVEGALAVPAADRGNLVTGCNGFPWSTLTPQ
jgi:hypothetical protein